MNLKLSDSCSPYYNHLQVLGTKCSLCKLHSVRSPSSERWTQPHYIFNSVGGLCWWKQSWETWGEALHLPADFPPILTCDREFVTVTEQRQGESVELSVELLLLCTDLFAGIWAPVQNANLPRVLLFQGVARPRHWGKTWRWILNTKGCVGCSALTCCLS